MSDLATNRVECADALAFLRSLPDRCVDLIATDPPYYRVKALGWDRAWPTKAAFVAWLATIADEWRRVLKPNGSLYCFASTEMAARVEVMLGERFEVLNRITWAKPAVHTQAPHQCADVMRTYFPVSEAVIFCEHFGADSQAKGEAGYEAKCDELRGFVFEPLRSYLIGEFEALGWSRERLNEICGVRDSASHYTRLTQWTLPTEAHYAKLQDAARTVDAGHLRREYDDLRREYEAKRVEFETLRQDFDDLRRPFTVTKAVAYTDVWHYRTEPHGEGKHPCEKPYRMAEDIVLASSKHGAVVLDTFCGSGVFLQAAKVNGRAYLGCDADPHWVDVSRQRAEGLIKTAQGRLL